MTFAEELKSFQNTHPFSKMKVDDIEVKYGKQNKFGVSCGWNRL